MVELFTILAFGSAIAGFATFSAHSAIYFMILAFLFIGVVYYLLTSTYLAMMLFVVYVGAVAMLFVFCVMLLNFSSRPHRVSVVSAYSLVLYMVLGFSAALVLYILGSTPSFDFFELPTSSGYSLLSGEVIWTNVSKDQLLIHTMYGPLLPVLVELAVLLFTVTVAVVSQCTDDIKEL